MAGTSSVESGMRLAFGDSVISERDYIGAVDFAGFHLGHGLHDGYEGVAVIEGDGVGLGDAGAVGYEIDVVRCVVFAGRCPHGYDLGNVVTAVAEWLRCEILPEDDEASSEAKEIGIELAKASIGTMFYEACPLVLWAVLNVEWIVIPDCACYHDY